ncbi:type II secretion system F family protein [Tenacibaculum jejuense]|uniref:Bacterial type II secretion system F domain protein n=1 Tax=Tenacibaculum jejuense TaxID=584609 RepID=A0A238U8L6_9FLAO|nr:type II secretion system F family protein [Tenacibaculum jejuense]SNR15452.1 Bacterial type II secretion system F domain protein [Tenacibaculum jejuense]
MGFEINKAKQNQKESSFDIDSLLKKEITLFGNAFSNKKREAFYTELYVLLQAGLELKDALDLIAKEQKKELDINLFQNIIDDLIRGKNFSDALRARKVFSDYEFYSVQIGEKTGTLQKVIEELSIFYKQRNEQRRNVINALSYPLIILFTAFFAVVFMMQFVVPMFADIFKQNKVELPWITSKIISASNFFRDYYWILLILLLGFLIFRRAFSKKTWYKKMSSLMVLKTPFVGEFFRKVKIAQFTQAITLLIGAKVPLLNGIQLTQKMITFYPLQQALKTIEKDILLGKSLSESISNHNIFDSKMGALIKVAEETNQNHVIFQRLTEQYTKDIEYRSKMLSSVLEPVIILFLGVIIATILIAMYIPMFNLSTVIG